MASLEQGGDGQFSNSGEAGMLPKGWEGLRLLEGTSYQQNQLKQEPRGSHREPVKGQACAPTPPTQSPRHTDVWEKVQIIISTLKHSVYVTAQFTSVYKGTAYWVGVLHLLGFFSLRLPEVSAFSCGTLHAPLICFPNKK